MFSINIVSEGGTEEDRRIDPPLNFGILSKSIIIFGKNWFDPPLDKENFSDPPLNKIRSALTVCKQQKFHGIGIKKQLELNQILPPK